MGAANLGFDAVGTGPPVVFLHAFPLSREMWKPQLAGLADVARVFAVDLPGFGTSPPADWTVDSVADTLAEWLTARGLNGPVVLGGLSMGGYVALAFARRYPVRLRGLILADTKAEADTAEAKANRDKAIATVREQGAAALFDGMAPKVFCDATRAERPEVIAFARRIAAAQPPAAIEAALVALRDRPDATPGLAAVPAPTLVIVGADDAVTPPAAARAMVAAVPNSRLVEIPAAGHLSNLERPHEFTAAVRTFLAERPTG